MEKCKICNKTFQNIISHHTNYEKDETIDVCMSCHGKIHNNKNYKKWLPDDKRIPIKGKIKLPNKCVVLNWDIINQIEEMAKKEDRTFSMIVKRILEAYLNIKEEHPVTGNVTTDEAKELLFKEVKKKWVKK